MRQHIYIVTDGSAMENPGPGGWAAILSSGRRRWRLSGAARMTAASEMELTAAIKALKSLENRISHYSSLRQRVLDPWHATSRRPVAAPGMALQPGGRHCGTRHCRAASGPPSKPPQEAPRMRGRLMLRLAEERLALDAEQGPYVPF